MSPKTFQYGETISYLKFDGNFSDQVEENNIISSNTGYSFIGKEDLGKDGSASLQLANTRNIVIKNVLNAGAGAYLTTPDEYMLKAFTTSFWIKQYSSSSFVDGYHPIKVVVNAKTTTDEDLYFTYTNKEHNTFDLEIKDKNGIVLAEKSLEMDDTLADTWMHISFVIYKGKLAIDDGTVYDGYFMDLFSDGDHKIFAIYEGENLPIIDKVISASIMPYDQENYLSNATIADFKIVNKLEYYPSDRNNFAPEKVDNGPSSFVFKGEFSVPVKRKVIRYLYHDDDYANTISYITANPAFVFDSITKNDWKNAYDLITPGVGFGKIHNDAVYMSGDSKQGLVLNRNILWGLREFTIAAWVKNLDPTVSTTLLEIVPAVLVDLTEEDLKYMSEEHIQIINEYKNKFMTSANSLNVNIYDPDAVAHGINLGIETVEEYIVDDWNYITTTFKDGVIRLYVNGKLIHTHYSDLELGLYNKLTENMYSVIGASFVDDLPANGSKSSKMYMDDFVIYDKALFTDEEFTLPDKHMDPYIYLYRDIYSNTIRQIINPASLAANTSRKVIFAKDFKSNSRRIILNPDKYFVFRFSV